MTYECLLYEVKDGIATLTLNRPGRLNALGGTLRQDLFDAVTRAGADPDVRVMVVTGAGKGFCSGGDVKAMGEAKAGQRERPLIEKIAPDRDRTLLAMREAPQPIIAAVNGAAAGAGMNLALGCDIRIASTAARFTQAFVKRGLHPDWGGTYFLPRVVGMAKACEMIFTGDIIDAAYSCLSSPHEGPVSVAAILAGAGLSTRAFYRHFTSKDELFLAMLKRDSDAVAGRLRRLYQQSHPRA